MTTPTIADCLKYANLQMAAEAFLVNNQDKPLTELKGSASHSFWSSHATSPAH